MSGFHSSLRPLCSSLRALLLVCLVWSVPSQASSQVSPQTFPETRPALAAPTIITQSSADTAASQTQQAFTPHRIAWGLSFSVSDISMIAVTVLGIVPAPMLSTLYEYHFSEHYALQTSLHFLHSSEVYDGLPPTVVSTPSGFRIVSYRSETTAHAVTMDISLLAAPFGGNPFGGNSSGGIADALRTLRVGGGVSLRSGGRLTFLSSRNQDTETFTRQTALGVNAVIEYGIPISDRLDFTIQARAQVFFPPIATLGDDTRIGFINFTGIQQTIFPTYGGMLGLGGFLRIRL